MFRRADARFRDRGDSQRKQLLRRLANQARYVFRILLRNVVLNERTRSLLEQTDGSAVDVEGNSTAFGRHHILSVDETRALECRCIGHCHVAGHMDEIHRMSQRHAVQLLRSRMLTAEVPLVVARTYDPFSLPCLERSFVNGGQKGLYASNPVRSQVELHRALTHVAHMAMGIIEPWDNG